MTRDKADPLHKHIIMGKKDRSNKDDEREVAIVTACTHRFDSYRYVEERGLVIGDHGYSRFVGEFLANPDFDLSGGVPALRPVLAS